jgi:hypothetical protein
MEYADSSQLSFLKFDELDDVVDRYGLICREIERAASDYILEKVAQSVTPLGLDAAELVSTFPTDAFGCYSICIINPRSNDRPRRPASYPVRGFGPIRRVDIECSKSLQSFIAPHLEGLICSLEYFHKLFTDKYIALHEKRRDVLAAGIEAGLLSACGDREEEIVEKHVRISVTPPFQDHFRFHVSSRQLRLFIRRIANAKFSFEVDPVLSMNAFLLADEADLFYKKFRDGQHGFLRTSFTEVERATINFELQRLERILTHNKEVSSFELCEVQGFSLQFSTSPRYESALLDILERCAGNLRHRFEQNVSNFQVRENRLDKSARKFVVNNLERIESAKRMLAVRVSTEKVVDILVEVLRTMFRLT